MISSVKHTRHWSTSLQESTSQKRTQSLVSQLCLPLELSAQLNCSCFRKKKLRGPAYGCLWYICCPSYRVFGRNAVRPQTLSEGTHLFLSLASSLTRNLLFELCLVDMLLIAKELKHPKQTSKLLHVLESTRIVATLRCLVTLIL